MAPKIIVITFVDLPSLRYCYKIKTHKTLLLQFISIWGFCIDSCMRFGANNCLKGAPKLELKITCVSTKKIHQTTTNFLNSYFSKYFFKICTLAHRTIFIFKTKFTSRKYFFLSFFFLKCKEDSYKPSHIKKQFTNL